MWDPQDMQAEGKDDSNWHFVATLGMRLGSWLRKEGRNCEGLQQRPVFMDFHLVCSYPMPADHFPAGKQDYGLSQKEGGWVRKSL